MSLYRDILRRYWHYDDFRPLQAEIIESIGNGTDTLALLPTGGGKSICFQVPALAMQAPGNPDGDGLCLVVTPLVALMKDQVNNLRERGIKAFALYAGQTTQEVLDILDHCQFGHTKFLYVSPERLESEHFRNRLRFLPVAMIAVDEAHCISQWGYDFRPPYLKIASVREVFPQAPVLALTASATPEVAEDIQKKLLFHNQNVFKGSFCRGNLCYVVRCADDKEAQLVHILRSVEGCSIVYVRSRQHTKAVSDMLNAAGVKATYFHAGLAGAEKDLRQRKWTEGDIRVMVATNAFGMGIDKPDVRSVIHIDLPDSLEEYFQEVGRAGRDGETAYAVLLYNKKDDAKIKKRHTDAFPDRTFLKRVYEAAGDWLEVALGFGGGHTYVFDFDLFCKEKHLPLIPAYSAFSLISQAGFWSYEDEQETPPRVKIERSKEQLNKERLSPVQEDILSRLMRRHTGLFINHAVIDETDLCSALHLSPKELTEQLILLSHEGIISYIPRRRTPYLTFLKDRVPLEQLIFTAGQYENKQKQHASRLEAMLEYATQNSFCRQQVLVGWFGENDAPPCGCCDVCRKNKRRD